jgi:hypothetical protein
MIERTTGGFVFERVADTAEIVSCIGWILARRGADNNIEGDVSLTDGHESLRSARLSGELQQEKNSRCVAVTAA